MLIFYRIWNGITFSLGLDISTMVVSRKKPQCISWASWNMRIFRDLRRTIFFIGSFADTFTRILSGEHWIIYNMISRKTSKINFEVYFWKTTCLKLCGLWAKLRKIQKLEFNDQSYGGFRGEIFCKFPRKKSNYRNPWTNCHDNPSRIICFAISSSDHSIRYFLRNSRCVTNSS